MEIKGLFYILIYVGIWINLILIYIVDLRMRIVLNQGMINIWELANWIINFFILIQRTLRDFIYDWKYLLIIGFTLLKYNILIIGWSLSCIYLTYNLIFLSKRILGINLVIHFLFYSLLNKLNFIIIIN